MFGDDEQAGEARHAGAGGERKRGDAREVDAHQRRGAAVERDRLEALAGHGALEEEPRADEHRERHGDDEEALVGAADRAHSSARGRTETAPACGSGGKLTEIASRNTTSMPSSARIGASIGAPFSTSGRTAMRSVAQPTTSMKASTAAMPSGYGHSYLREQDEPAEGAEHRPLADREVDDPGRPDHQQVGERDQAVDAAGGGRAYGQLEEILQLYFWPMWITRPCLSPS